MMLLFTEEPTHTMLPHNTVQQKDWIILCKWNVSERGNTVFYPCRQSPEALDISSLCREYPNLKQAMSCGKIYTLYT